MLRKTLVTLCALNLFSSYATGAECDRVIVELISSSQPSSRDPGDPYNIFDGSDDHAIYHSAADWIRDPDTDVFLDGIVDLNFGMNFGNGGEHPEGFDRQVKQLHEYRMDVAYGAGVTSDSLVSATVQIVVDGVLDMSLSGQTDLVASEWVYVNVFAGDGLLTTLADAQVDYDRCDRKQPASWDVVHHLVDDNGFRISQDGLFDNGGQVVVNIDVTEELRTLLSGEPEFAGFSIAGSADSDFVLLSVDGGSGTFAQLPRLILVGPALGDFDESDTVDLLDFATFQGCFTGDGVQAASGCTAADLDMDSDVDSSDLELLVGNLAGPDDECSASFDRDRVLSHHAANTQPGVEYVSPRFFGDFNDDGELNSRDREFFMTCVDNNGDVEAIDCSTADLNNDGRVNERDLGVFLAIFTE